MKNLITFLFVCLTTVFAAVNLSFDNVDTGAGTLSVVMENDEAVGGFQFDTIGGTVDGCSGGSAADAGWIIQVQDQTDTGGTRVMGFSFSGTVLDDADGDQVQDYNPSTGILCTLENASDVTGLKGIVVSDLQSNNLIDNATTDPCIPQ